MFPNTGQEPRVRADSPPHLPTHRTLEERGVHGHFCLSDKNHVPERLSLGVVGRGSPGQRPPRSPREHLRLDRAHTPACCEAGGSPFPRG